MPSRVRAIMTKTTAKPRPKRDALDFLVGGGEMGERIRNFDWSTSPLGPIEHWPQSLLTSVGLMLNSRHPMFLAWGQELAFLYNDGYRPVFGQKHPAALGQPFARIWAEIWNDIRPLVDRALAGEPTWSENLLLFLERSGFAEETYFTFSYSPVRDETGQVGGMFCACTETTQAVVGERQLALLRELAATDARYRQEAAARSAEVLRMNRHDFPFAAIYLANADNTGLSLAGVSGIEGGHPWAPEKISFESITAFPLERAFRDGNILVTAAPSLDNAPAPLGAWNEPSTRLAFAPLAASGKANSGGVLVAGLNPFRRFDDNYRNFLTLVVSQISSSIASAQAFDEEKQRAEGLAELDRAKTVFFSNVSHEFRTPLTLLLGPLEDVLARRDNALPESTTRDLEIAHRNALRLLKLVNTLLEFSRIEAGRINASYEPIDLAAYTAELASTFRSAIEKSGLRLVIECPPLPRPVFVDREMWEKIVLNLLSNAFKFTFDGEIKVAIKWIDCPEALPSGAAAPGCAELTISDTGVGIAVSEQPNLFKRFHRVRGARSRTHEGTGIGLALVQELARLHGGEIRVRSEEGKGSAFIVTVPAGKAHLRAEHIRADGAPSAPIGAQAFVEEASRWLPDNDKNGVSMADRVPASGAHPALSGARIVLADDNADMREYVQRLLLHSGCEVRAFSDGSSALAAVRQTPPDIILADVMMPGLDGFGLLAELRGDPRTRSLPVILLSARAGEEARVEGISAGADDYITKPFSGRELLARVEAHVRLGRMRHEAGEAIRVRAEQLAALIHSAPIGIYLVDADLRILQVNPVAEPVFGDIPGGVIGRNIDDIIHILWEKNYADEVVGIFRRTLETGEPYAVEERAGFRIDRKTTEYYDWRVDRITLPDGRHGLVCYFRDIARQVLAAQELARSREQLQLVSDSVPALISYVDTERRYRMCNRAYQQWFGLSPEQVLGRTMEEVLGLDAWKKIKPHVDAAFAGQKEEFETEARYLHGATRWIHGAYTPHRNEAGAIDGVVVLVTDITAQKRAEKAVRESEERFRNMANHAPVMVWMTEPDGSCSFLSESWYEFTGQTPATGLGLGWLDAIFPGDRDRAERLFHEANASCQPFRLEYRLRRKDGEYRWAIDSATPRCGPGGECLGYIGSVIDIHERKQAEELMASEAKRLEVLVQQRTAKLREAIIELEAFSYSVAHDLRAPLRAMHGYAVFLLQDAAPKLTDQSKLYLERIQRAATRLDRLTQEVLTYSKLSREDIDLRPVDLDNLVREITEQYPELSARAENIRVHSPLLPVLGHESLLTQALSNLLANACKFVAPGATPNVVVGTDAIDNDVRIWVEDNGIGIATEHRKRLFQIFGRVHPQDKYEGTGIGLAIVKKTAEKMGGSVGFESEVGRGSRFWIQLRRAG